MVVAATSLRLFFHMELRKYLCFYKKRKKAAVYSRISVFSPVFNFLRNISDCSIHLRVKCSVKATGFRQGSAGVKKAAGGLLLINAVFLYDCLSRKDSSIG